MEASMSMEIQFWGVRGSIATPGASTVAVGGNTPCVEVRTAEHRFILDAGTGLRALGEQMARAGTSEATLLLSHLHWDHIQGLPFFVPAYLPTTKLTIVGAANPEMTLEQTLSHQMQAPVFPVRLDELRAEMVYEHAKHGDALAFGGARVRAAKLNHPGGVLAYRIEVGSASVVYATDTEHYACVDPALVELARGADVLIYDAMYTPEEYRGDSGMSKVGWGHSTWEAGVQAATAAGVGQLVLFHHDPGRSDEAVAAIEATARAAFGNVVAAREGMTLSVARPAGASARGDEGGHQGAESGTRAA
jgi:phosphoribosyl 1,2-cyclic phosphodiesterase